MRERRFWRSKLSTLSKDQLIKWATNKKCVQMDMTPYMEAIHKEESMSGLSLWTYAVLRPHMLKDRLGMKSELARASFTQAVCREIEDSGCLKDMARSALDTEDDFYGLTIVGLLTGEGGPA